MRRKTVIAVSSVGLVAGIVLTVFALFAWGLFTYNPSCSNSAVCHISPSPPTYALVNVLVSIALTGVSAVALGIGIVNHPQRNAIPNHSKTQQNQKAIAKA